MANEPARSAKPFRRRVAPLAVIAVLAAAGTATRPFSWPATALVVLPAAVVLMLAFRVPTEQTPSTARLRRGVAVWSTLLVAGMTWEAYAFARQPDWTRPSDEHPTFSTLLDPALEQWPPLRFAGWFIWLGVGWWLVSK
ncbi:hypothetical protein [Nocardia sp. NPDC050710]|uniref:hypothetical protein n=1 Tax=Nocardia sp. NPDC050710 TaxID=3157220 RepID=UPI0033DE1554